MIPSISVRREGESRRQRNLYVDGLPNVYGALRWWDPTRTGSKTGGPAYPEHTSCVPRRDFRFADAFRRLDAL
jgi:hypothetical protein